MGRPLLAVLALVLLLPAAASANFRTVLADYRGDGRIDPCAHSPEALRAAQRSIPADIEQYAPDFPSALAAAIEARARGVCDPKPATTQTTPAVVAPPATRTPKPRRGRVPAIVEPPAPAATPAAAIAAPAAALPVEDGGAGAPAPLLGLGILLVVGGLAGGAVGAARLLGYEGGPVAHAWGEASWRAEGLWEDFVDWLKFAR